MGVIHCKSIVGRLCKTAVQSNHEPTAAHFKLAAMGKAHDLFYYVLYRSSETGAC